jgi:hypothetical protein
MNTIEDKVEKCLKHYWTVTGDKPPHKIFCKYCGVSFNDYKKEEE